jgi:hypothetical protein
MMLTGCATPPPADGSLHIVFDISGRLERRGVALRGTDTTRDGCDLPRRARVPTAARPAPADHEPPNIAFGYSVHYGPHFASEAASLAPEWRPYGPQSYFAIEVFARPGALEGAGPVPLGRGFRISVGTAEGLWERTIEPDDPSTAGTVTISADGTSGRFRVTGLVLQIPHNRMPDTEAINVSGTWRCPSF